MKASLRAHIDISDDEEKRANRYCHVCGDELAHADAGSKPFAALLEQEKPNKKICLM
jgi:hypothetical protein